MACSQVFELLSRLNPTLVGFDRSNWQSTIRHYVRLHADYANLSNWGGKETSDIVYADASGRLTTLLISKGYLSEASWLGKTPRYYIEVKSTTDSARYPSSSAMNNFRE